jgi:HlyD family secretion protein
MEFLKNRKMAVIAVAGVLGLLAWMAWPQPVAVDLAVVGQQAMEVTVDEEARTRVRHIYAVSAPVSGAVQRARLEAGDAVVAGETVVALMRPAVAPFHDARLHQELAASAAAAEAAIGLAEAEQRAAAAALQYIKAEFGRVDALAAKGMVSRSALNKIGSEVRVSEAALASAAAALRVRHQEHASAVRRLQNPTDGEGKRDRTCCIVIRSPVTGQVLRRLLESEATVPAGTPLLELGDSRDLEVVAELLSSDAVQVRPGAPVRVDGWGGAALRALVRRVEPAGFQKISALGIEEQRVRAVIDLIDAPERWRNLGHDYRVIVHVETWRADKVVTVPVGALFRAGDNWAVFRNVDGRARLTPVSIDKRNAMVAQVLSGLSAGDRIIVHPSDRISDGVRIAARD